MGKYLSWTIRKTFTDSFGNLEESWIEMIGSDEWWCSSQRLGYSGWGESVEDFIEANNVEHRLLK